MSKKNTKEIILSQALKMFNEQGIEYVGMREIAKELDLRVGNVTYYFPTKDDLVLAITLELAEANNKVLETNESLTMAQFLDMYVDIFANHYRYRCLFISFVHLLEQNPKIEQLYLPNQEKRYKTIKRNLSHLKQNGFLEKQLDEHTIDFLVSAISLMVRFWLSEARIRFRDQGKKVLFKHYLELFARLMLPYATKEGKKEIHQFIDKL